MCCPVQEDTNEENDYVKAFPEPPMCGVSSLGSGKVIGGIDAKLGMENIVFIMI